MSCPRCKGTGWYSYDHNHSTICPDCCLHDKGVWLLKDYYGQKNGEWCCLAGCGTVWATQEDYERRNDG